MSRSSVRPRWGIPLALPHLILSLGLVAFIATSEPEPAPPASTASPAASVPVAFLALAALPARP